MPHIENHFDAEILAHGHLGDILREAVAAVRKDVGAHFRERPGNTFVGIAFLVVGEDDLIHERQVPEYLGALFLRHEGKAFLHAEPVVVVHDNDELVAERTGSLKHPHVPDVKRGESTRDGPPTNRILFHATTIPHLRLGRNRVRASLTVVDVDILPELTQAVERRHEHPAEVDVYIKYLVVGHIIAKTRKRR